MLDTHEINRFEKNNSDPKQILDFITKDENNSLIEYFNTQEKIHKNTGPIVANIDTNNDVFDNIFTRLKAVLGEVTVMSAIVFETPWAHVIHNDVDNNYKTPYKAITIPLKLWGDIKDEDIKLMMFDQYYYHAGKKFMNGGTQTKNFYKHGPLLEYTNVSYTNDKGIAKEVKEKYLTHLQPNWLEGLSIHSYFPWKINSAIIFDVARLHSSSDFNALGVERKMAMSIFTAREQ
jgi:hypothetical protein